jgi:hypothetical protein
MQASYEMGIDTYLIGQTLSKHRSLKCSVKDGESAVRNNGIDMSKLPEVVIYTHQMGRKLMLFVANESRLFDGLRNQFDIRKSNNGLDGFIFDGKTFARCGRDAQLRVKLGEHGFNKRPESIHYAKHTDHCGSNHTYSRGTDGADDIDGIMALLGKDIPPCYMSLYLTHY